MATEISNTAVKEILKKYYKILRMMGYAGHDTESRVLVATFLLDLYKDLGAEITEQEKKIINGAFNKLGVNGGCVFV